MKRPRSSRLATTNTSPCRPTTRVWADGRIAATSAKHEQVTAERIARQCILHQRAQTRKSLAHVGCDGGQPYPRTRRNARRHHAHRCNCAISAHTRGASSTELSICKFAPDANVSCRMLRAAGVEDDGGATVTGSNRGVAERVPVRCIFADGPSFPARYSARQWHKLVGWTPSSRAIARVPSRSVSSTMRCFSERCQRRRSTR